VLGSDSRQQQKPQEANSKTCASQRDANNFRDEGHRRRVPQPGIEHSGEEWGEDQTKSQIEGRLLIRSNTCQPTARLHVQREPTMARPFRNMKGWVAERARRIVPRCDFNFAVGHLKFIARRFVRKPDASFTWTRVRTDTSGLALTRSRKSIRGLLWSKLVYEFRRTRRRSDNMDSSRTQDGVRE